MKMDLQALAGDKEGNETGKRLYLTYCMQCHGADVWQETGLLPALGQTLALATGGAPVSYTHLDVYKRQIQPQPGATG